jgi:hypothetical protein
MKHSDIRNLQKIEQRKKLEAQAEAWRKFTQKTNEHYSKEVVKKP